MISSASLKKKTWTSSILDELIHFAIKEELEDELIYFTRGKYLEELTPKLTHLKEFMSSTGRVRF